MQHMFANESGMISVSYGSLWYCCVVLLFIETMDVECLHTGVWLLGTGAYVKE